MSPFSICSIDPYGYATKSLAMNEFLAPRYGQRLVQGGATLGEMFLEAFGLPTDPAWCWGGVVFIIGYAFILVGLSVAAFVFIRFDRNIGSARTLDDEPITAKVTSITDLSVSSDDSVPVVASAPRNAATERTPLFAISTRGRASVTSTEAASPLLATMVDMASRASAARLLPFESASVAFRGVTYTVQLSRLARVAAGGVASRQLLRGISGFAEPGRMLALMGASGAGACSQSRFVTQLLYRAHECRQDDTARCLGGTQEQRHNDRRGLPSRPPQGPCDICEGQVVRPLELTYHAISDLFLSESLLRVL